MKSTCILLIFSCILFSSCVESYLGPAPVGGDLPTNYIAIKDSAFTPNNLTLYAGSTVTFVNNTSSAKKIVGTDSTTLPAVTLAPNSSFTYRKDTVASIFYKRADNAAITGVIHLVP